MTSQRLLEHFDRISDAPDAIPRLRRFILDLAVRGKLVPQDPNDEPASKLLEKITHAKRELFDSNKLKRSKEPGAVKNEIAFDTPEGWISTRLGTVYDVRDGTHDTPKYVDTGYPLITSKNLSSGRLSFDGIRLISEKDHRQISDRSAVAKGDILLAMIGSIGNPVIVDTDRPFSIKNVALFKHYERSLSSADFLCLFLQHAADEMGQLATGGLQPFVSLGFLRNYPIALPPLAEQHRIVAKVDELMALCDRLEASQAERESRRDRLAVSSLNRLNNGADADAFREHARFYFNHLPHLTTRIEHIQQLRQTILNLAVIGKLTERLQGGLDAHDELLAVDNKKRKLALRKAKPIMPIAPVEEWCDLPNRWVWARWDQITDWITYGFTRPMPHEEHGVPIVTGKNVNYGRIIFETAERTTKEAYVSLNDKDRPKPGDILVTKDGSIGRSAIVTNEEPFCINQSVAVLWLRSCHFNKHFLQLAIDCPQTQQSFLAKTEGVAIKHISVVDLGKMVFPLPPLAEQQRIVAKVEELMALCDRLEGQLTTTHTESRRLLEAVIHEAMTA